MNRPSTVSRIRAGLGFSLALACLLGSFEAEAAPSNLKATQGAEKSVRRFSLTIGSSYGGRGLDTLQYAFSDAVGFGKLLADMGGVRPEDMAMLENPTPAQLDAAFAALRTKVTAARAGGRTEAIVYYSGHADGRGLRLGDFPFDYDRFRRKIDSLPVDVRIAVLDACASGAITRLKGGKHRPAFTVDVSSDMKGYAFITSSSPEEASQESDQIRSSFFTHYLVSGLRGAADVSGDGKVTLGEAYQFAFHETLARTERTKGGAQHPAYDMKLSGTGDVVMTDMRSTASELVLESELEGRFFIRNPKGELVAELFKPSNRTVSLGLPPGEYTVRLERARALDTASFSLTQGGRDTLTASAFRPLPRESTAFRGGASESAAAETGRDSTAGFAVSYSDQVDLHAGMNPRYSLSLGLLVNHQSQPFHGLQLAFLGNYASQRVWGSQIGLFGNVVGDSLDGAQASVFLNLAGGTSGFQGAPIMNIAKGMTGWQGSAIANINYGNLKGFQGSAVLNVSRAVVGSQGSAVLNVAAGSVRGVQGTAVLNVADSVRGAQVAGVVNVAAGPAHGAQVAGVLNVARGMEGAQIAGVSNISFGDAKGAQVSPVLNVARDVRGCQVGVVNISRDIQNGIPIGLFNYSHTGLHSVNLWADEQGFQLITLQSGSRHFYTFYTAGEKLTVDRDVLILGGGFGGQYSLRQYYAATDFGFYTLHDNLHFGGMEPFQFRLRALAGYPLLPYLSAFGGVSLNVLWKFDRDGNAFPIGDYQWEMRKDLFGWPGLFAGLRVGV